MKKLLILLLLIPFSVLIQAQEPESTPDIPLDSNDFVLNVFVDSAFVRELPTRDSEPTSSVFEGDSLVAVGRNIDGTWFQVRKPFQDAAIGWINRTLVGYMFSVGDLPLTDLTTGLVGEEPVFNTGVSVFILTEVALRAEPDLDGDRVGIVPIQVTIPVVERTPDSRWLRVNYLGTTGWIAEFLTSTEDTLADVPVLPSAQADLIALEIIPIDVQISQAVRFQQYLLPIRETADEVATFWGTLAIGEIIPCNPPAGGFTTYNFNQRDLVELPELRRHVRRIPRAINDLNESIEAMQRCGVYLPSEISNAYAKAINARVILDDAIEGMRGVEFQLRGEELE